MSAIQNEVRLSRSSSRRQEGQFGLQVKAGGRWTDLIVGGTPFRAKTRTSAMLKRIEAKASPLAGA